MVELLKKLFVAKWLSRKNVDERENAKSENRSDKKTILEYFRLISQTDQQLTQQSLFFLRRNHFSLFLYVKIRLFLGNMQHFLCLSQCEL